MWFGVILLIFFVCDFFFFFGACQWIVLLGMIVFDFRHQVIAIGKVIVTLEEMCLKNLFCSMYVCQSVAPSMRERLPTAQVYVATE